MISLSHVTKTFGSEAAAVHALDNVSLDVARGEIFGVLATTSELENDPRVTKLFELLLSDDTKQFLLDTWGGLVVPTA